MLLCTKNEIKPLQEWAFQYKNAPLYLDRYEALTELGKKAKDSISATVIISALNDNFWSIRNDAILLLKDIQTGNEKIIKEKLVNIAKADTKTEVRASSIYYLSDNYKDADLQFLYKSGLNDKSYSIIGASLSGIAKADPMEGMKHAKQFENDKSVDVLYAVADLYSKYGSDENNDFFIKAEESFTGFNKIGFITEYAEFLRIAKKEETVNTGAILLERIAKDESISKWVAYYAKKSIKDLAIMYEDRESVAAIKLKNLKASDPNPSAAQELESEFKNAGMQKQKMQAIYNGLK
jgi:aminopeptidase N